MHWSASVRKPYNSPIGSNHILQLRPGRFVRGLVYMRSIFRQGLAWSTSNAMTLDWFGIGISCIWLGQCDDHSNVQIAVGPAVQAMADTGSKGIILNFQFGEIDPL